MKLLALLSLVAVGEAHMGVSTPRSMDAAVGDAYRYPNAGVCHGKTSGGTALSGSTTLKMSSGAAHNGGPCAVFHCPTLPASMPTCTRNVVNTPAGCTKVVETNDCTTKGSMDPFTADKAGFYMWYWTPKSSGACEIYSNCWTSAAAGTGGVTPTDGPTTAMDPIAPTYPPGGTATKIRCGTTWTEANGKCGTQCTSDKDCPAGEGCYADLRDCPAGAADPAAERPTPAPVTADSGCVSISELVKDSWCQEKGCDAAFADFCSTSGTSQENPSVTVQCELHVVVEGEKFQDVAFRWDVNVNELKAQNPTKTEPLAAGTVLEISGDCKTAREQAAGGDVSAVGAVRPTLLAAAASFLGAFAMW